VVNGVYFEYPKQSWNLRGPMISTGSDSDLLFRLSY